MKEKREHIRNITRIRTHSQFEAVYKAYAPVLYEYGCSKMEDPEKVSGIVQEVFISLWERRKSLKIETSLRNYLIRAVKFKIIDVYRSEAIKAKKLKEIQVQDSTTDLENDIAYKALKTEIEWYIRDFPEIGKKAFRMSRIEGFTNREIADMLSVSERTVAYHLAKINDQLKRSLLPY
ncbi:sigma-70 family RNA polymerase sigma factor [Sinomicrobium soli]|uniref:sigma-70 family RNA polymerase sigma factor n=1 Tax=Sinomicrobium sp. N-1-3-6 TaxID=2219864 RepID=UPI000DCC1C50|nr:sigma-70 family RNA polymerase sigma factor [Sinomicrobium sp. N-1-3-6]RAV29159.1 hypothetical protein DN748_09565 [Sinomicrobium sp. N-1-3-6]